METNLVCEALATLASMLLDPEGAGRKHLKLLFLRFGSYSEWPQRVHKYLEGSLLIAFSVLWRKLYLDFQCYPWLLAPAFDLRRSWIERRATLQTFVDVPWCCLDKGLCTPLRARHERADDYFEGTVLHDFLVALFERVVVTSSVRVDIRWLDEAHQELRRRDRFTILDCEVRNQRFHATSATLARESTNENEPVGQQSVSSAMAFFHSRRSQD